jgi:signal transduction histidine kinase
MMQKVAVLTDKAVLFVSCLAIYVTQQSFVINVALVLIVLIISSFLSYFDNEGIKTGLTLAFAVFAWFYPALLLFLPLIAYDLLYQQYRYFNLPAVIPAINFLQSASLQVVVITMVLLLLAVLIRLRMELAAGLQVKYRHVSDGAREMALQLQKQNKELIEKQDNELTMATLNERNRIARDIHDNVGHLLSSAILQAGALRTIISDAKAKQHLELLQATLAQAMDSTRDSVHSLYEEAIDLRAQVESLLQQFTFCELSYEYCFVSDPGTKLKYAFVAIVKEALSNIIKHSNATRAEIIFREHPALYQLIIRDNGGVKNYDPDKGIGLKNMVDRVHAFNGNINIITESGFEVFISIPKGGLKA